MAAAILNFKLKLGTQGVDLALNETFDNLANAENTLVNSRTNIAVDLNLKPRFPDRMVTLVHFGRSGTGLLHSLIDGHPEVSTLPSIYFSQYFRPSNWEKIASEGLEKITDKFIEYNRTRQIHRYFPIRFDQRRRNAVNNLRGTSRHISSRLEC